MCSLFRTETAKRNNKPHFSKQQHPSGGMSAPCSVKRSALQHTHTGTHAHNKHAALVREFPCTYRCSSAPLSSLWRNRASVRSTAVLMRSVRCLAPHALGGQALQTAGGEQAPNERTASRARVANQQSASGAREDER